MKTRAAGFVSILAIFIFLAGCASMPQALEEKEASREMRHSQEFRNALIYVKPNVDVKKYRQFYVEPVRIYRGADAQFADISEEQKQKMADFIRNEFIKALKKSFEVVDKPGPGVLRIRFTLAGLQETVMPLATVTHALPAGLVVNLGLSAAHMNGSFMGSIVFGGEFFDGETGELEAAFLARKSPNAMNITTIFAGLDAAKWAVTDAAEQFRALMVEMHEKQRQIK